MLWPNLTIAADQQCLSARVALTSCPLDSRPHFLRSALLLDRARDVDDGNIHTGAKGIRSNNYGGSLSKSCDRNRHYESWGCGSLGIGGSFGLPWPLQHWFLRVMKSDIVSYFKLLLI